MLIVALVCCQMTLSKGWLEGTWGGLNGPVPWTPLDTAEETAARLGSTVTTTLLKTVLASRITTADGVNPEWR